MKLLIDIPESKLWSLKNEPISDNFNIYELASYIDKGTPLPKNHGKAEMQEKIDKAIEEMNRLADHKIRPISFDQSVAIDMCIDILKKYIESEE